VPARTIDARKAARLVAARVRRARRETSARRRFGRTGVGVVAGSTVAKVRASIADAWGALAGAGDEERERGREPADE